MPDTPTYTVLKCGHCGFVHKPLSAAELANRGQPRWCDNCNEKANFYFTGTMDELRQEGLIEDDNHH